MSVRPIILEHIVRIAAQQKKTLAPLTDSLPLLESGLDSLCIAILVASLDDSLGVDPFDQNSDIAFPVTLGDFIARTVGLGVNEVTLSGIARLDEHEVLALAGISPKSSIPFLDVDAARARLEKAPLVASASGRKLYPNRVIIDIVERAPAALWQTDGDVSIVAADGGAQRERPPRGPIA